MIACLHGFAGTPAVWDGIAPAGARCLALPGHGGGPVLPTWDANLAAIAAQLAGTELVVGYSLGARVALGLVAAGHVPRALLISVNPGIPEAEREARRANDAAWAALLRAGGIDAFAAAWEAQPLFASQVRAPATRRAARRAARRALDPHALAASLDAMGLAAMPDYRDAIAPDRIALVAGADDAKFLAIARSLPAPLTVIADSGHDPTLEQPSSLAALLSSVGR